MLFKLMDPPRHTLDAKAKGKATTVRDRTEVLELRNTLSKDLLQLRQAQRIYMPGLDLHLEDDESANEPIKLWLPSELTEENRTEWCLPDIPGLEVRFRYAQANDRLVEIRRLRRLLQSHLDQKAKHLSHAQRNVTRGQGVFDGVQNRIRRATRRYRHSRQALLALDPSQQLKPGWADRFRELADADVQGPGREVEDKSEGTYQPSWIWLVPRMASATPSNGPHTNEPATSASTAAEDLEVINSMRVHWARCQARAERYEEEVMLTVEEMGRTLRYFEWKKSQWLSLRFCRKQSTLPPPIDIQQGLEGYACRQAHVYETLIVSFANLWRKVLVPENLGLSWLGRYPVATDPLSTRPSRGHSQPKAEPLVPVSDVPIQTHPPLPPTPVSLPSTDPPMEAGDDSDDTFSEGEDSDYEY